MIWLYLICGVAGVGWGAAMWHGRALDGERNLRIWTDRGYREVPREDFDRIAALKARLSRASDAEDEA